jgi:hypothetical protein
MPSPVKKRRLVATAIALTVWAVTASSLASPPPWAQGHRRGGRALAPPTGTGRLRNVAQGMCLDVAGWAAQGNSNVLLGECNNDPDHVWSFTPDGELRNTLNGTCLDAAGYDGAQGANIDVFRCESVDDQRWTLVARGRDTFELRNGKSGLCLDVNGTAGARGDNVLLWPCDGGPDQLWSFEPYAPPPPPPPAPPRPVFQPPRPPGPMGPPREERRRPRPMDDQTFGGLVAAVRNERTPEARLTVIEQATMRNYFRVDQVKSLIDVIVIPGVKLRVLELGAPRVVDPENAFTFYDAFPFNADKEKAKAILRRNGI